MAQSLLIIVHFHDGRYHGTGDWPPSPARLFQALIAASAANERLPRDDRAALDWLERIEPPDIAVPRVRRGQRYMNYVPNNDLDKVGGDPRRIGEIRDKKVIHPYLFDPDVPFLYVWRFDSSAGATFHAAIICAMAQQLYQFGRGVDMAWAHGETLDEREVDARLASYPGVVYRPSQKGAGVSLDCPTQGSLETLETRFDAQRKRLTRSVDGPVVRELFSKAPQPRFRSVPYNSPPARCLFELRASSDDMSFRPWPHQKAVSLVVHLRDRAVDRLTRALPERTALVERVLIGRDATDADKAARVRIVPLPSVGHGYADHGIRRVLIDVPVDCPIPADDIAWAFSGLVVTETVDTETGEVAETTLVPAAEETMLTHYGLGETCRSWRSVTPVALPELAARRRIDPHRLREEAKAGTERAEEQYRAATAVIQALRHVGIDASVRTVRIQREPFAGNGARAEVFASGTRFHKERLWHLEVGFTQPVVGPLIIGDGRYAGLGLMAPVHTDEGVFGLAIVAGMTEGAEPGDLTHALRRAVMARARDAIGGRAELPTFFTGHALDGKPSREAHVHLAFVADLARNRLLVVAPHLLERRQPTPDERKHLRTLDLAVAGLTDLRAGEAGRLMLAPSSIDADDDPLLAPAQRWESATEYVPTRYAKRMTAPEALASDARLEIRRRGMPLPEIEVIEVREGPRGGLAGHLRLRFRCAVSGPILIGRNRHFGGGLFSASEGR